MGGRPTDSSNSFTSRASTLTIDLVNFLTSAQIRSVARDTSDEFFTIDTVGRWSSEVSKSPVIDVAPGRRAVLVDRPTLPDLNLMGWAQTNSASNYYWNGPAGDGAIHAQTIISRSVSETGHKHPKESTSIAGTVPYNPFVHEKSEFGLSMAVVTTTHISNLAFSPGTTGDDKVADSVVPEPRLGSMLLLLGMMAAVLARQRISRTT